MKKENITIKKCLGCGATLQFNDQDAIGFIPEAKYLNSSYCQRCYRLKNYNKKNVSIPNQDNGQIIKNINRRKGYVFFLVDLFNINQEVINTFLSIKLPKTLLVNKSDLIPKGVHLNNIEKNIRQIYLIKEPLQFISTKRGISQEKLFQPVFNMHLKNAYILGYTNAGKSSLINNIMGEDKILTSNMPNTTLDFINIKVNNLNIYDTPGFTLKKVFYQNNDWDLIKKINDSKMYKPLTYQTKNNQIFN